MVKWYTDKDYSGGNMNHPGFKEMCADIVSGNINAVVVTELSRLNRNVKDFCQFWDFAQRYNVKLISLKENFLSYYKKEPKQTKIIVCNTCCCWHGEYF